MSPLELFGLFGLVAFYLMAGAIIWRALRLPRLLKEAEGTRIPNTPILFRETEEGLLIERVPGDIVLWGFRRAVLTPSRLLRNGKLATVAGYRLHRIRTGRASRIRLYAILPDGTERTVCHHDDVHSIDISGLVEVMTRRGLLVDHSRDAGTKHDVPPALRALRERR